MNTRFAETLRRLRTAKGLSQKELAKRMYVTRPTVARWESGSRMPDAAMISQLSECLGVDVNTLLSAAAARDESPNVIMVDDRKIILTGGLLGLGRCLIMSVGSGDSNCIRIPFTVTAHISDGHRIIGFSEYPRLIPVRCIHDLIKELKVLPKSFKYEFRKLSFRDVDHFEHDTVHVPVIVEIYVQSLSGRDLYHLHLTGNRIHSDHLYMTVTDDEAFGISIHAHPS